MGRKTKALRKFNGKYYVRVGAYANERIAQNVKNNLHGAGKNALIIFTGTRYAVYTKKHQK